MTVHARSLASLLLTTSLFGCPSYTQIADPVRAEIDGVREGQLLWLRQSLFVGQFYDDDRYELVYPRRFEEISYLRTVEGDIISPPPANGIIPAGTRVRVEKIDWPTGEAVFRRPLYTPRYATWVVLRVARDRGDTYLEREKQHVLLLPGGIPDFQQFDQWFSAYFTEEDPNPWLLSLGDDVRDGVFAKRPVVGMDYDTLTAAMGYPDRMTREGGENSTTEVVIFGPVSCVLENGVVTRVSDPLRDDVNARPAPDASANAPTTAPANTTDTNVAAPAPALTPESRLPTPDDPSSEGDASSSEGDAPSSEGGAPSSEGDAPSSEGDAPSSEGDAPSSEGGAPSTEGDLRSDESGIR